MTASVSVHCLMLISNMDVSDLNILLGWFFQEDQDEQIRSEL